jgi:hypothetical protein
MSMTQHNLCKWGFSDRPVCRMGVLNRLLLACYNLVGSLPSEIGNDRSIDLSNDTFTWSITTELATIVNLEDFLVVGNQLIAYHRKDLLVFLFGRMHQLETVAPNAVALVSSDFGL